MGPTLQQTRHGKPLIRRVRGRQSQDKERRIANACATKLVTLLKNGIPSDRREHLEGPSCDSSDNETRPPREKTGSG